MALVVIADTTSGIQQAIDAMFSEHGGVASAIPQRGGTVYIKPNAVHFAPHTYTDPQVLDALLGYLRDHGYGSLAVMEGCTEGCFTRLVFRVTPYLEICRRHNAEPVYLDEGLTVAVELADGTRVRISRRFRDQVVNRGNNVYLSLPKLKTHSMTTVTLGVKNQQGLAAPADRMQAHCHDTLHPRLAALYALAPPDFCIIEGENATAHGHLPPTALLNECLVPTRLLVGGADTLAVDTVGAHILGYNVDEVEHLRLCAGRGLGQTDLGEIDVRGVPLERFQERVPYTLLRRFHPGLRWVVGRERACVEGCRGSSECVQELLYNDYNGGGGWTLVCGSGFTEHDLVDLPGDILVVGPCACSEVGDLLARRYRQRKVLRIPEHIDLMSNTRHQAKLAGVIPLRMVPTSPLVALWTLLVAKLHGLHARVPPVLG